jgi:high-affinity nickel-transport protein
MGLGLLNGLEGLGCHHRRLRLDLAVGPPQGAISRSHQAPRTPSQLAIDHLTTRLRRTKVLKICCNTRDEIPVRCRNVFEFFLRQWARDNMRSSTSSAKSGESFSAKDRRSLGRYVAAVAALHIVGWGLCLIYTHAYAALLGMGLAAYLFGLRHAFDADHIAAIDDTVRFMLQKNRGPLGVGFFFSLGHSTFVLLLAVLTACVAALVKKHLPGLEDFGNVAGTLVSGVFLWAIGLLNLAVLLDMLHIWRRRHEAHSHVNMEELLARRGLLNRVLGQRLTKLIEHSWQMYPVGFLFGLGFDTASEVALLALTGGAAVSRIPVGAVLALPILFTAGMSMMDTADGVLMTRVYGWAFFNPVRRIFYNITTTSLSVAVALVIGSIELAQVLIGELDLHGPLADGISNLDFGRLGYVIIGMFVFAWILSYSIWKVKGREHAI